MKGKGLLVAFLLAVGLCFVPNLGHGEIEEWWYETKASLIDVYLLRATISYMMHNPASPLFLEFAYDETGLLRVVEKLPEGVNTKGKILVLIGDTRDRFSYESGIALLNEFKRILKVVYSFVDDVATDMDFDIVGKFVTKQGIPLAYFYQGEYHLWPRRQQGILDYSKRPQRAYSRLGGGHWIAEKIERGRQIKLEDGSLWKISVRHRLKTMLWEVSQEIAVAENDDLLYPYRLINQNTGDTVEAELVSE